MPPRSVSRRGTCLKVGLGRAAPSTGGSTMPRRTPRLGLNHDGEVKMDEYLARKVVSEDKRSVLLHELEQV